MPAAGTPAAGLAEGRPCPAAGRLRCPEEEPGSSWPVGGAPPWCATQAGWEAEQEAVDG